VSADPLVSVLIPVFDAEAYLDAAVRSILDQTHRDFELLLLLDGGSTDASGRIAHEWSNRDARVHVLTLPHMPAAAARLVGARDARGAFVAFQDADDCSDPDRFAAQLAHMERQGLAICGCQVAKFGQASGTIWFPQEHDAILHEQLFRFGLFTPALMVRKAVLLELTEPGTRFFEDFAWWNALIQRHPTGNSAETLYRWRLHADNMSMRRSEELLAEYRAGRETLFATLFPEADAGDLDALNQVAERAAHRTPEALDLAGRWLVRLAEVPDARLKRRMAERWRHSCERAAGLGPAAWRIYRRHRPGGFADGGKARKLFALTRLRTGTDSPRYRRIASLARRFRALARQANPVLE
jgi:glycosyltransferase involved in cell wall biosynthesis